MTYYGGPKNNEHMPFAGHRILKEVREDEEAHAALIRLRKRIRAA